MENLVTKVCCFFFFVTTINFIFVTAIFPLNALITGVFNEANKKKKKKKKNPHHYVYSTVKNKVFSRVCSYILLIKGLTLR